MRCSTSGNGVRVGNIAFAHGSTLIGRNRTRLKRRRWRKPPGREARARHVARDRRRAVLTAPRGAVAALNPGAEIDLIPRYDALHGWIERCDGRHHDRSV